MLLVLLMHLVHLMRLMLLGFVVLLVHPLVSVQHYLFLSIPATIHDLNLSGRSGSSVCLGCEDAVVWRVTELQRMHANQARGSPLL